MPRVVHFEIHAENPERAVDFYSKLFDWKFMKWSGPVEYWLINTGQDSTGINGGLVKRRGGSPVEGQPVNAFACTVEVDNIDPYIAKVGELGGAIVVPKMPIPDVGWLVYAKDTEGNLFGIIHRDAHSKAISG